MTDILQRSLAGGEIAPALYARTDLTKYQTGLRRCRNFQVQRHGGVANRAGTRFVCEVKDSSRLTRLIKFVFNSTQTYVLEFGHLYMRVIKEGVRLDVTGTDAPVWSGATNYVVGNLVTSVGIRYYCILAHINQIPPNATYWYPLSGNIFEIPTPYVEGDLRKLKYVQSADVVTITHPSYDPRDLNRMGDVFWSLVVKAFAPSQGAPTSPAATPGGAGAIVWRYKVTAIAVENLEESLPTSSFSCTGATPTSAAPNVLTWLAATPAPLEYDVYREVIPGNGIYGFIGTAAGLGFNDPGVVPNAAITPPITRNPFSGADNKPEAVGYYQQRQVFAGTNNNPETVYTSRTGHFPNFTISSPIQDDDAVSFTLAGKQVNRIRALVDLKKLVIFTDSTEWSIGGDASGVLRPGEVNPTAESYHGIHENLLPITIGNTALFVQARGSVVRDLAFDISTEGYKGNDLTLFAVHLFDGHDLVDWDYSQIPNSVVWGIREDGMLLGLTYIRDQAVWGWHRHDTAASGLFEAVCVVPEGLEDKTYFVVNREIGGLEQRYIERLESRLIIDLIEEAFFVDSGLSYNGWNVTAITMTLTNESDTWQSVATGETWTNHGAVPVADGDPPYVDMPDELSRFFNTPDSVAASVTGDIDLRVFAAAVNWTVQQHFMAKRSGGQTSYDFNINAGGQLAFYDGVTGYASTNPTGFLANTAHWVRVTRSASTGDVKFYTSSDGVAWIQFGATQAGAAGALSDSTVPVEVGSWNAGIGNGSPDNFLGKIFRAQVLNGINGSVVVDLNPQDYLDDISWSHEDDMVLVASAPQFVAGDVGNAYVLRNAAGDEITLNVTAFTDTTHVTVRAVKTVPVGLRNVATSEWSRAVDLLSGLDHLEGEAVSILADGNVVADGVAAPLFVVTAGAVLLDRPYSIIHIGLPITAEIETLDIDNPEGSTLLNKINMIKDVDLVVESSRGILAGPDEDHLEEFKQRDDENYGQPTELITGVVRVPCDSTYALGGRVFIRQKDPLPLSILGLIPGGMIKGGK